MCGFRIRLLQCVIISTAHFFDLSQRDRSHQSRAGHPVVQNSLHGEPGGAAGDCAEGGQAHQGPGRQCVSSRNAVCMMFESNEKVTVTHTQYCGCASMLWAPHALVGCANQFTFCWYRVGGTRRCASSGSGGRTSSRDWPGRPPPWCTRVTIHRYVFLLNSALEQLQKHLLQNVNSPQPQHCVHTTNLFA